MLFIPISQILYNLRRQYSKEEEKNLWIDVGAGEGNFLKQIRANQRIGVEISEAGRKFIEKKGLKSMTPEKFLKSRGLNAAAISFWHVLEHTENPWKYLQSARANIAPTGEIIIGIPNISSWEFRIFGRHWFHLVPQYHIWHFSPESMIRMLTKNGFEVRKVDYISLEHHLSGLLQSFINKTSKTHNILHKMIKRETDMGELSILGGLNLLFWLSFGLPIVLIFWLLASLFRKSGTIVLVGGLKTTNI